jgi:hypothetical protein
MDRIGQILLDLGFIPALGTTETLSRGERYTVLLGRPKCYNANNGVVAVYDAEGRPWVADMDSVDLVALTNFTKRERFYYGAYVPHSNDGGAFLNGDAEIN